MKPFQYERRVHHPHGPLGGTVAMLTSVGQDRNPTCPKKPIPLCPLWPCQMTLPASDDFTTHLIINPQAQFPSYHSSFDPGNILEGKWPTTLGSINFILCTQAFQTCLKTMPLLQFSDSSLSQPFLCHIPV